MFGNSFGNNMQNYLKQRTGSQWGNMDNQLADVISRQLRGEGLGMSPQEMQTYMSHVTNELNRNRQNGISSTLQGMNARGLLGSDMTVSGLQGVERDYSKSLTDAQSNLYLQNEAMKRQGMQNAMGMAQNYTTAPWQMGLQYQQYFNLPRQQQSAQSWQNLGQIAGAILPLLL